MSTGGRGVKRDLPKEGLPASDMRPILAESYMLLRHVLSSENIPKAAC
jgi:hypothetical protein